MNADNALDSITAIVALATFAWSAYSFIKLRAVEAAKPYLEKKLDWCETAVKCTSRLANSDQMDPDDIKEFWQLYWGVMALIEKDSITNAMIEYGKELNAATEATAASNVPCPPPHGLKKKSLILAHSCRQELSVEWSPIWSSD